MVASRRRISPTAYIPIEIGRYGSPKTTLLRLCTSSLRDLGGSLTEQVARDVDQREPSSLLWQFVTVGLKEYLDSLVAGMNLNSERRALEIDFVTAPGFAAHDGIGHLHSCEWLIGQGGFMAGLRYRPRAFERAACKSAVSTLMRAAAARTMKPWATSFPCAIADS
jgi:hypothetical protein